MATRSKFERQLNFRSIGFSIKIPDVGRSLKPFDYVVGVPAGGILRFFAIEAKTARGWTMNSSVMLPHQIKALDFVENLAPNSSWLAVGFLDIPNMKLDHNRQQINGRRKKEAFLLPWSMAKSLMGTDSLLYGDLIDTDVKLGMIWKKQRKRYRWSIPKDHLFYKILLDS